MEFIADAEYCDGWVIAIFDDCFPPFCVVHGKFGFIAFGIVFIGETDFHVDKQSFFISRFDKFDGGNCTVKANQIEAVFFSLANILYCGIL